MNTSNVEETNLSRRASRISSTVDEAKSVKFASPSSSLTKSSSRNKANSIAVAGIISGQQEEVNTISTIRTLLQ